MHGIGNKWNKRICKWIATVLVIVLLANQFNMTVSASEQMSVDILTESGDIAEKENNAESAEVDECEENTETVKNDEAEENGELNIDDHDGEDGAIENEGEAEECSENDVFGEGDVGEYEAVSEVDATEGSGETYTGDESSASDVVGNGSEENASDSSESAAEGETSGGTTVVVSRTADVVFVIDVSSSMNSYINKVKARIAEFIALLNEAGVNVRIKFVLYSDITYGETTVYSEWCSTVEEATTALNNIRMLSGGDGPEAPLDGMGFMFQDDFGWRESIAKFSILLTDAPYKTDNTFGYTFDDITDKLEENDIVSSVIVPNSYTYYDGWLVNEGKKGDITSDFGFLLDWVDEVILPGVDTKFQNVTIQVIKDNDFWTDHGRNFILQNLDKGFYVENFNAVENGNYRIYEVTASGGYLDTGECIAVAGEDVVATVNYYTVRFFDGDNAYDSASEQAPQIVLNGQTASRPNPPTKPGYSFNEWMTENNGTTPFDFSQGIGGTTSVYARWSSNTYSVDIKVQKDSVEWEGHGKTFYLQKKDTDVSMNDFAAAGAGIYMLLENDNTDTWITNLAAVENGIYDIYDATDSAAIVDTGVTVTVSNSNAEATINYYTVTFYNDAAIFDEQIVLSGTTVHKPSDCPTKEGSTFNYWSNVMDGSEKFNFADPIMKKTDVYASWLYTVVINIHKDGSNWDDGGKTFALAVEDEETITFFDDFKVPKGVYKVYDTTGATDDEAYEDTGETVTVSGVDAAAAVDYYTAATVDYYTVTLYNDDTVWGIPQTVRKRATASRPAENPTKDGYTFYRWTLDKDDSSTDFNFGTPITGTTNVYASWTKDPDILFTITVSAGGGGSISPSGLVQVKSGDDQQFVITPDKGYQVVSIVVDDIVVENDVPITYDSAEGMDTISGSITASVFTETNAAANTSEDSNIKYYLFKNVTEDHTLTAFFEPVKTKKRSHASTPSDNDDTPSVPVISPVINTDTSVIIEETVSEEPVPASKDSEPKTGETSYVEIYATIGMIAGLSYLLLYFADGESGMTEEQKKEIVGALVKWARKGKRIRKCVALAIVFVILVYYHSIGKRTTAEWKELYEK